MENEKVFYQTSDINLAATLVTIGFTIETINPMNPNRVMLYFDDTEELRKAVENYWNDKLTVVPREFINNRRDLMSRVKQGERELFE
jgi:hypothetical protein